MNCDTLDWDILDRLRAGFIGGGAANGPYWQSPADLANYDATYAERIGWKWDALLRELARLRWRPRSRTILDWGCGSGVAGRRVVDAFFNPSKKLDACVSGPSLSALDSGPEGGGRSAASLQLWDHSALARNFAATRARAAFPGLNVSEFADTGQPIGLLVISHVINELPPPALQSLLVLVARAESVLWVEPGTHAVSRQLIGLREQLLENFRVIAPCPHQAACGLLAPGNERHWCHFFAEPPPGVQNDSDWVRFGHRAGVDLRSQAYSCLVLDRQLDASQSVSGSGLALDSGLGGGPAASPARILGRAEHFKGFARILSCEASGVAELELQKRASPALFKELKADASHPLYRWTRDEKGRITAAEQV